MKLNFRNKIVNDLAWVIGSVPLMSYSPKNESYQRLTSEWFKEQLEASIPMLEKLDESPAELENFVNRTGRQLLGKRFESFVEYWLTHSERFEILLSNEQIKDGLRTIGEVDFVFKNHDTDEVWHVEVACKYYLASQNSSLWPNWKGINAQDSLEQKMTKFERQLQIFSTENGKEILQRHRIKVPSSFLYMKGYFFYYWKNLASSKSPKLSAKNHCTGVYLKKREMGSFFKTNNEWVILKKHSWFSPYVEIETEVFLDERHVKDKVEELLKTYKRGVMLARIGRFSQLKEEDLRVVVVPDDWPNVIK